MDKKRLSNIIACTLITGGGQGILNNTLNIYIQPVTESLGFARTDFSLYSTIIMLVTVAMAPIFAKFYQRRDIKRVLVICTLLCSLATLGFSISTACWHFYVFAFIFGLGFNGVNLTVAANIINQWFDRRKGIATGIAFAGSGFFAAGMVAVLGEVITSMSWRWSYRISAVTGFILMMIAIFAFLKVNPTEKDLVGNDNEFNLGSAEGGSVITGLTRKEALRTPMFYCLLFAGYILGVAVQGGNIHMIAAFTDAGHDYALVTKAASVTLLVLGVAKICIGKVNDFLGMVPSLIIFSLSTAVSFVCLLLPSSEVSLFVAPVLIGIGAGGYQVTLSLFVRDIFGNRDFAGIFAIFNMFQLLGTATGAVLPSMFFDGMGSYMLMWKILMGFTVLAVVLYYSAYRMSCGLKKSKAKN